MNSTKRLILNKQGMYFGQNYIGQGRKIPITQGHSLKSPEIVKKIVQGQQSQDCRIRRYQFVVLNSKNVYTHTHTNFLIGEK